MRPTMSHLFIASREGLPQIADVDVYRFSSVSGMRLEKSLYPRLTTARVEGQGRTSEQVLLAKEVLYTSNCTVPNADLVTV